MATSNQDHRAVDASRQAVGQGSSGSGNKRPAVGGLVAGNAKSHPVYPVLQHIAQNVRHCQQQIESHSQTLKRLEQGQQRMMESLKELSSLIKQQEKKNFDIKTSGYDEELRNRIAAIYCCSVTREIPEDHLKRVTHNVLGEAALAKHKYDASLKFLKRHVSVFKTEERRRIYGIAPCQKHAQMTTSQLAESLVAYMKAPDEKLDVYTKNLALLRKFTRENKDARNSRSFSKMYSEWVKEKYPSADVLEQNWKKIMEEDAATKFDNCNQIALNEDNAEDGEYDPISFNPPHDNADNSDLHGLQSLDELYHMQGFPDLYN